MGKFVTDEMAQKLREDMDMENGDLGLVVADADVEVARTSAGRLRAKLGADLGLFEKDSFGFIWITDFPMFERDQETGRLMAMHHPFTSPRMEDPLLETDPLKVKTQAYDIVVNGQEIGGGSVRIHDQGVQARVFKALGLGEEEVQTKFGFLLDALTYGAPPHGGLAFGFDRMAAILAGTDSIRDVIAFPKTTRASCIMTNAPSEVDDDQLKELGLARAKQD